MHMPSALLTEIPPDGSTFDISKLLFDSLYLKRKCPHIGEIEILETPTGRGKTDDQSLQNGRNADTALLLDETKTTETNTETVDGRNMILDTGTTATITKDDTLIPMLMLMNENVNDLSEVLVKKKRAVSGKRGVGGKELPRMMRIYLISEL
jgi:hypothetical protein